MKKWGIWIALGLTMAVNFLWIYREQLPPVETLWAVGKIIVRPVALPPDPQGMDATYLGGWQGYDLYSKAAKSQTMGLARFELLEKGKVIATSDCLYPATDRLRVCFRLRQPEFDTVAALRKSYPQLPRPERTLCLLDLYVSGAPTSISRQTHLLKLGTPTGNPPSYFVGNVDRKRLTRVFDTDDAVPLHEFSFGTNTQGDQRGFTLRVRLLGREKYQKKNIFSGMTL